MADFDDISGREETEDVSRSESNGRLMEGGAAALRDPNKVFREHAALLELAHDAIIVRDLGARIKYWNKAAEKAIRMDAGRGAWESSQ